MGRWDDVGEVDCWSGGDGGFMLGELFFFIPPFIRLTKGT